METRIIVPQPLSLCNLNCSYCYLSESDRQDKQRMSFETLEKLIQLTFNSSLISENIHFNWHAGEPLLAKIDFYEAAINYIYKYNKENIAVEQSLQTNGTLINKEWCQFFKEHDFGIGVSIDGPAFIHNIHRKTWSGRDTYQLTMNGIDLLKEHSISFGISIVLTKESLLYSQEIYNFLVENDISQVSFNIEEISGGNVTTSLHLNKETSSHIKKLYNKFMSTLFDLWVNDNCRFYVREFNNYINKINNKLENKYFLYSSNEQIGMRILTILKNGDITTFSPQMADGTKLNPKEFVLGNVHGIDKFEDIVHSEKYIKINSSVKKGISKCMKTCLYYPLCGGGHPAIKYYENNNFETTETNYCAIAIKEHTEMLLEKLKKKADHNVIY